jgi:hypothetical protein
VCNSSLPPPKVNLLCQEHSLLSYISNWTMHALDNKNRYTFCFYSLLVANGVFREVYVNFMLVGHTHEDIDALFGR